MGEPLQQPSGFVLTDLHQQVRVTNHTDTYGTDAMAYQSLLYR